MQEGVLKNPEMSHGSTMRQGVKEAGRKESVSPRAMEKNNVGQNACWLVQVARTELIWGCQGRKLTEPH